MYVKITPNTGGGHPGHAGVVRGGVAFADPLRNDEFELAEGELLATGPMSHERCTLDVHRPAFHLGRR